MFYFHLDSSKTVPRIVFGVRECIELVGIKRCREGYDFGGHVRNGLHLSR